MKRAVVLLLLALPSLAGAQTTPAQPPPATAFVLGLEGGVAQIRGDAGLYELGYGKLLVVGHRWGPVSLELHTLQSFLVQAKEDLHAENTVGHVNATTIGMRYSLELPFAVLAVHAGAGRFKVPVLTARAGTAIERAAVRSTQLGGVGLMGGVAAGIPLFSGAFHLTAELRGYYARWEIPGEHLVSNPRPEGDGTYVFERSAEDLEPLPVTLTLGLRAFL